MPWSILSSGDLESRIRPAVVFGHDRTAAHHRQNRMLSPQLGNPASNRNSGSPLAERLGLATGLGF